MGEGNTWGFAAKATFATLLLVLGGVHRYFNHNGEGAGKSAPSPESVSVDDDADKEDFALFTHEKNQLHCMERELRHPCVRELRDFVSDEGNAESREEALRCVNGVLTASNDYWELKNMTHLLLDLDTVGHVFDKSSRNNDFVLAGVKFAEKLMEHEECIEDFDKKNEMETRCVPLYGKIVMLKYKNAGMDEKAMEIFTKLSSMSFSGKINTYAAGEAIRWDHWQHTPQIWVKGLRSVPVWPRETWGDLPICKQLEDNFETLREEAARAVKDPTESGFEDAYRFLYEKGEWNHILLYHDRKFTDECEAAFPKMCALLKQWLPSKPGLPWLSNQGEQAMVIKMKKGTDVERHSGPANNILNIHIGISGLKGARLQVANETYSWEEGKVIAWDGSYDHAVDCVHCEETERVIMMVRYMHPDMSAAHFKGMKKTHYEEIPLELQ